MEQTGSATRCGIAVKTSFVSGMIILFLLALNSFIAIRLQSGMSDRMIDQFVATERAGLEDISGQMKEALDAGMKVNLEICSSITTSYLYDFDQEKLYKLLSSYLKLDGMVAIKVLDADGNPFGAAWKNPEILTGERLPDTVDLKNSLSIASDAVREGKPVGRIQLYYTDAGVQKRIREQEESTLKDIRGFQAIAQKNIEKSITTQIVVAAAIVLSLIISLVVSLKVFVTRPISRTNEMIRDIAQGEGDLTRRLMTGTRDEIGDLATGFNGFVEKLQTLIRSVTDNARTIDRAASDFTRLSADMHSDAETLSAKSKSVSDAAENMSANMACAAKAMDETAGNISMVAAASEEMTSTIGEIASNAENARVITDGAVSQTRHASDHVNELGQAASRIGKVVETITDISEQVNLLALNATIEAARAGEAGRGFAVVANEIKALARQTSEASGAIKDQIQDIQSSTETTVSEISAVSQVVTQINSIVGAIAAAVEEQSATTAEMARNISHASSGMAGVNDNVSQGASASRQVALEISEITESVKGIAASGNGVRSNADRLESLSRELSELMGKFKV